MPPKKTTSKKAGTPKKQGKITGFFSTTPSSSKTATKRKKADDEDEDVPPAKRVPEMTPEQQKQMDQNKSEAEVKLLKRKLGVDNLDPSWVDALYSEFKKPYFTEVIYCTCTHICVVFLNQIPLITMVYHYALYILLHSHP